ncbi:hypothetical protein PtB15_7B700 [Puccinia triticina]|nr:hypothetical protein PtB15_7B700 [Puccinia triticina]
MDNNISNPAENRPNQHNTIQYSSRFTAADPSKPVPLAHFMGARRDLNGPVLTKQRVDEKEIRPDGWESAEKRFQQAQSNPGLSSLASLLAGPGASRSNTAISSHAGNLAKRALPGMVPQDRINSNSQHGKQQQQQQRDTIKHSVSSKSNHDQPKNLSSQAATSHAASYLKPKSLADRLAQLGVSNDVQTIKTSNITTPSYLAASSPRADKFPIDQPKQQLPEAHELGQSDLTKKFNRITKASSPTFNTTPLQNSSEEKPDGKQQQRPLSLHINPTPRALPPTPNPQPRITPSPQIHPPKEPVRSVRPNDLSQPTTGPSYKRNTRPQSALPHAPHISTEGAGATLGVPNKALTASLSRLAGSNIVAQRLEWSKQKEQLGTMDEFGSPLLEASPISTSSALNSQIPSPVLPSQSINQNPVLSEHSKNSNDTPTEPASRSSSQTRLHSVHRENTGPKQTEPGCIKKQLNQYNKSTRSDEDDDQRFGINKRNKKNIGQLRGSSPDKKENEGHVTRTAAVAADVQPGVTSPLRLSHKSRARTPRRPSGSSPTKWRAEATKLCSSPGGALASRQLPSLPSFSPLMKKGTSELAAVWGTQLANPTKKVIEPDSIPKKPSPPLASPLNSHRPLPTPPPPRAPITPGRPKTATTTDSRPLPVPPSAVAPATTPLSPEPRARTRPLPTPQLKAEPTTLPKPAQDKQVAPPSQIDASKIWASYAERQQSLAALGQAGKVVQLEIFQLNRNQTDELSTTMLDTDEYGTFYSQESLLIICTMKGSRMVLMVWRGRDVGTEEDDGETEGRIGRLLKKYGIDGQARLVIVHQGYEPPELVQALGGRLLLRTGDRFDSVYQRGLDAVLTCKSFPLPTPHSHSPHRVVVIEELFLNHPTASTVLCTGYPSLVKICSQQPPKLSLFLWKGRASDPVEVDECKLLAAQVRTEFGASKTDVEMVEEGNESERFLSMLGAATIARSYHWRYKELVPMSGMVLDSQGTSLARVSGTSVSVIWTGLELFVLVPSSPSSNTSPSRAADTRNALRLAHSLAVSSLPPLFHGPSPPSSHHHRRRLAVHCLFFPSIIPVDLRASVRFSADLDRLNEGFPNPQAMNVFSLDEATADPSFSALL